MTVEAPISEKQSNLIAEFASLPDWTERYKRIIEIGNHLESMPEELKTEKNKLKGCQSTVWMDARLDEGRVYFWADSDAAIVKGLVGLLLYVYSGETPSAILAEPPRFLEALGLGSNLSQTRVNGLASMVKQIRLYAYAFQTLLDSKST